MHVTAPLQRPFGRPISFTAALILSILLASCKSGTGDVAINVIPYPAHVKMGSGEFILNAETVLSVDREAEAGLLMTAYQWSDVIRRATGYPLLIADSSQHIEGRNVITLSIDDELDGSAESYHLVVSPDGIRLTAPAPNGIFYGLQTLQQLLPPEVERDKGSPGDAVWAIPAAKIDDTPRFRYRGMHLDVGRHFFSVEFIKRYIDLISRYKMNYFHWHLTEDQGWRIEIKNYPRLTEVGSRRKETILDKNFDPYVGDGIPYGGFYTQDEIREIVIYAETRFVTVIPEIEMPGHSGAALAAYPELACTKGPFEVSTVWGVDEDILCPSERTFTFIADVLSEVMSLFPSTYIHIGGDEAPKTRWKQSKLAQQVIRDNNLADESELQSWFIRRIESFLTSRNKKMIGWDEILEGGLAPEATVMSWRGISGGIEAAKAGHDVIMTPTQYAYFDHYQGDEASEPLAIGGYLPLDSVYAFEPVPSELDEEQSTHIIGAQGNVWTEYIKTPEQVEYMAFPRAAAMAEVVWSPKNKRNYGSFLDRLKSNLAHLQVLGVNYRVPDELGEDDN